jgi:hypothetical protein
MISPIIMAKLFLETFDGSAVAMFRQYLARNPGVTKWMIAADFALHDPQRPMDCMSFTVLPYDASPDDINSDVTAVLPRDLKRSKELPTNAAAWLRDCRRFHVIITMNRERRVFYNGAGIDARTVAREHIELTLSSLVGSSDQKVIGRFKSLRQKAQAKAFNVDLLSDIWMLGIFFATLTVIIGRNRQSEIIGWFPDRDNMTNWCDGIWRDYAYFNTHAICDALDVNMSKTRMSVGVPDRSGAKEVMWFDYMIRAADWFAGAIAAWDRTANQIPGDHSKYRKMLEDVVADADNIVLLHCDVKESGAQFRRAVVTRNAPHSDVTP